MLKSKMGDNMKILYKQSSATGDNNALSRLNITSCYLKEIRYESDYKITTLKSHSHTEYEIHMVFCGKQSYEIDGRTYDLHKNEFIIIPPKIKHRSVFATKNMTKCSITFNSDVMLAASPHCGKMTEAVTNGVEFILSEFEHKTLSSSALIENRVFEILILLLRLSGYKEQTVNHEPHLENDHLKLAKKFILDNIEQNLSVADVASYCYLSTRQLTRIFVNAEGIPPAKYISREKMKKISEYIKNSTLSLKQISELFSYNNEFYFNSAFKKYFGIPPLAYRKMFK